MQQGETVSLEFISADASTAASMVIKDANQAVRTLGSRERLLIDTLSGTVAESETSPDLNERADVFASANGTVDATELIASFTGNSGYFDGGCEGYSCPRGQTPKVVATGAAAVRITGVGRIIQDGSPQRPSWKESLIPGA